MPTPTIQGGVLPSVLALGACIVGLSQVALADKEPRVIENGNQVSLEYTLKLADGTVADSNVGGDALRYQQGANQILASLEAELLGLAVGDTKQVALTAAQGYGEIDPDAYQTVPVADIPEDARHVGAQLIAHSNTGEQRPVKVHEVSEEEIVLDLNHPLAGEALQFDIRILGIE